MGARHRAFTPVPDVEAVFKLPDAMMLLELNQMLKAWYSAKV